MDWLTPYIAAAAGAFFVLGFTAGAVVMTLLAFDKQKEKWSAPLSPDREQEARLYADFCGVAIERAREEIHRVAANQKPHERYREWTRTNSKK